MGPLDQGFFSAGVLVGTHGLRGDIKVRPRSGPESALLQSRQLWLRDSRGEAVVYDVKRAVLHKGNVLLQLVGIETIDQAEPLIGREVLMRLDDLVSLPDDEFYWHQLDGLTVVDRVRGELGTLVDIFTTGAHDIYVVKGPFGEVLIPAVDAFILEIDHEARRMEVDLPEGLVSETDEV